MSITDRLTDRATTRGPSGPKKKVKGKWIDILSANKDVSSNEISAE